MTIEQKVEKDINPEMEAEEKFWRQEQFSNVDPTEEYRRVLQSRQVIRLSKDVLQGPVLDIGTGYGMLPLELKAIGYEATGTDVVESDRAIKASADDLPFPDNTFGTVYMNEVYNQLRPEVHAGIGKEIFRVLRPGGHFVLMDNLHKIADIHQTTCPACGHEFNSYFAFRNADIDEISKTFQLLNIIRHQSFKYVDFSLEFLKRQMPWLRYKPAVFVLAYALLPLVRNKNIIAIFRKSEA